MTDVVIHGRIRRISQEAPIPVFEQVGRMSYLPGGASNVFEGIRALGGDVFQMFPKCETTYKTRFFVDGRMMFRHDDDQTCSHEDAEKYCHDFLKELHNHDIVVMCDYGRGSLWRSRQMLEMCVNLNKISIVDPKGSDWDIYKGATYIKCNHHEYLESRGKVGTYHGKAIVETLGGNGARVHPPSLAKYEFPGYAVSSRDPTGCGDSFLSAMAVALAEDYDLEYAVGQGNRAGAIAVQHLGTHIVTKEELDAFDSK